MTIEFTVPGLPIAKGRPRLTTRGGNPRAYTPARTRKAESDFALQAKNHRPPEPLSGPVMMVVTFVFPYPKAWSKKRRREQAHTGRPDLDNCLKMVTDALNGTFWLDDSQIAGVGCSKVYGEEAATHIVIQASDEKTA